MQYIAKYGEMRYYDTINAFINRNDDHCYKRLKSDKCS